MKKSWLLPLGAFAVLGVNFSVYADTSIQDLKLIHEKANVQADGTISLKSAFAGAGLPPDTAEVFDTDTPSAPGSYPAEYTSSSYPAEYTSTSYPSEYTSTSYPSEYTSTSYPSEYTSTSYPSEYTSTSYPAEYTSTSYPAEYTSGGTQLSTGNAPALRKLRYAHLPTSAVDLQP